MGVLSGIQSSGKLHMGNYLGAMKQHIEDQHVHDCFFFIACVPRLCEQCRATVPRT